MLEHKSTQAEYFEIQRVKRNESHRIAFVFAQLLKRQALDVLLMHAFEHQQSANCSPFLDGEIVFPESRSDGFLRRNTFPERCRKKKVAKGGNGPVDLASAVGMQHC